MFQCAGAFVYQVFFTVSELFCQCGHPGLFLQAGQFFPAAFVFFHAAGQGVVVLFCLFFLRIPVFTGGVRHFLQGIDLAVQCVLLFFQRAYFGVRPGVIQFFSGLLYGLCVGVVIKAPVFGVPEQGALGFGPGKGLFLFLQAEGFFPVFVGFPYPVDLVLYGCFFVFEEADLCFVGFFRGFLLCLKGFYGSVFFLL